MAQATRHDAWQAGDSYDLYMGRWSRQIAPLFLDWLDPPEGAGLAGGGLRDRGAFRGHPGALQPRQPGVHRPIGRLSRQGA